MSIRLKLILTFLAITIIPILSIGFISLSIARNALMKTHIAALEGIADIKVDKIESFLFERKGDIRTVQDYYNIKANLPIVSQFANDRTNPVYIKAKKMLDDQLKSFQEVYKYENFMLVNPEGKIVYVAKETHAEIYLDHLLSNYEGSAFDEGKKGICFSDIYEKRVTEDSYSILITAPIHDFNENFVGVVAIEADMERIYSFIQDTTGLGKTGETLIGKDVGDSVIFLNRLRYDTESSLKRKARYGGKTAFPIQEAVKGRNGSGLSVDYRDEEIIAAWRQVPSLDWGLVAKIDTKEAFAFAVYLRNVTIFFVGITMVLVVIVALFFAKKFSDPITRLTQKTKLISRGGLTFSINTKRNDEIGQLSNSFDTMVHSLKHAQEELVRKEKFAIIGRMSGSIAHDIRHPLATIKNSSYFLKTTLKDADEKTKKHLSLIDSEITHADEIIEGFMRLSESKMPDKASVNINECIRGFFAEFPLPELIKLTIELDSECSEIIADRLQLKQAFSNITSNALRAMPDNGTLTVKARRVLSEEAKVPLTVRLAGKLRTQNAELEEDFVEISFADTGSGIKQEIMDKIFEPLFTTSGKGMGLGLSIVKDIITSNGGNISVESEEGKGSTFKIKFPVLMH